MKDSPEFGKERRSLAEKTQTVLLARLRAQLAAEIGPWTRGELYARMHLAGSYLATATCDCLTVISAHSGSYLAAATADWHGLEQAIEKSTLSGSYLAAATNQNPFFPDTLRRVYPFGKLSCRCDRRTANCFVMCRVGPHLRAVYLIVPLQTTQDTQGQT